MREYYVYIISNRSHFATYTGVTNDLLRRLYEHKNKIVKGHTSKYNINKLLYYEVYDDIREAIAREKQIKKWGSRKKLKLIKSVNSEFKDLSQDFD